MRGRASEHAERYAMNVEHLVTMANQIADFFISEAGEEAAPREIASHMTKFWAPPMRAQFLVYVAKDGAGLRPSARAAASLLAPVKAASTTA
jgi:formate dehydrogenase subunit delta